MSTTEEAALREKFRRATSIRVQVISPRIAQADGTGTITFDRRYEVVVEGQSLQAQSTATMQVRQSGGEWVIERLRFELRR